MAALSIGKKSLVTSGKAASCHAGHILLLVPMLTLCIYTIFFVALRPNAGHCLLILEFSRSHTTTYHSR